MPLISLKVYNEQDVAIKCLYINILPIIIVSKQDFGLTDLLQAML